MRIVSLYYRHRFPAEIISHCVWLYFRFSLSFRDVEELMSSRGVSLSYETVREWCVPRVIITDKLKSYRAARAELMPSVEHVQQKYQNNRAENSHQPTRLRERAMRRFKSAGHAQRFLSAFGIIASHFRVGRNLHRASGYRDVMRSRFSLWEVAIGAGTHAC